MKTGENAAEPLMLLTLLLWFFTVIESQCQLVSVSGQEAKYI